MLAGRTAPVFLQRKQRLGWVSLFLHGTVECLAHVSPHGLFLVGFKLLATPGERSLAGLWEGQAELSPLAAASQHVPKAQVQTCASADGRSARQA